MHKSQQQRSASAPRDPSVEDQQRLIQAKLAELQRKEAAQSALTLTPSPAPTAPSPYHQQQPQYQQQHPQYYHPQYHHPQYHHHHQQQQQPLYGGYSHPYGAPAIQSYPPPPPPPPTSVTASSNLAAEPAGSSILARAAADAAKDLPRQDSTSAALAPWLATPEPAPSASSNLLATLAKKPSSAAAAAAPAPASASDQQLSVSSGDESRSAAGARGPPPVPKKRRSEMTEDEIIAERLERQHEKRLREMQETEAQAKLLTEMNKGKHHLADFLPKDIEKQFQEKLAQLRSGQPITKPAESGPSGDKLTEQNKGYQLLQKSGWKEGQGLGAQASGIKVPVNAQANDTKSGIGTSRPEEVKEDDDVYEMYRKKMMVAYQHRPNPLNNPRRKYY